MGDPFAQFVQKQIFDRNQKIVESKNLAIDMDPDVAKAFVSSNAVSSKQLDLHESHFHFHNTFLISSASKGNSAFLLKVGTKRRRTRQEIQDQKEEAELKQQSVEQKLSQIDSLMQRCAELEQKAQHNEAADLILRDMINKG